MDKTHTVKEYEEQLSELRGDLHGMAERVEDMITDAISALVDGDAARAESTVEDDRVVNHDEMMIDDLCIRILAKRQPMASDLRLLTTALKMVTDLERIGDCLQNIGEAIISAAVGERMKMRAYRELAGSLEMRAGEPGLDDVEFELETERATVEELEAGRPTWFEVALIPTTLELTTLGQLEPGATVNLEMDILTKTVVQQLRRMLDPSTPAPPVNEDLLRRAGFMS